MYTAEARDNKLVYMDKEDDNQDHFETTKSGIIFLEATLRVKSLNKEAEKLLGVTRAYVLGKRPEVVFQKYGEKFLKIFAVEEYDEFYTTIVKLRVKDRAVYAHIDALKLTDSVGDLSGVIVIIHDVSAVRAAVKQIQTTQMLMSLGELAAGIAHHVRTPLTTISGYLQVMKLRLDGDQYTVRREVVDMLLSEAAYVNNVVTELVLFAKPPVRKETGVNINLLVEEALYVSIKEVEDERIAVDKQLIQELPSITADATLLKQALTNIIKNAIEAIPGQGIIKVKTWRHSELNMLVIAVVDNGSGVPTQVLPRVFEPFYTTKLDRLGLGLSTAYRIFQEHGGFANISSDESQGTKVHIYLPIGDEHLRQLARIHQQVLNLK